MNHSHLASVLVRLGTAIFNLHTSPKCVFFFSLHVPFLCQQAGIRHDCTWVGGAHSDVMLLSRLCREVAKLALTL